MSTKRPRGWQTGLLALGLLAGCGGSASRREPDAQPPSSTGGTTSEPAPTAGQNSNAGQSATAGSAGAPASGGSGASSGGSSLGGSSHAFGGSADAGAAPELMLPAGCRARTPMESADICSLAVDCDTSPSVRTHCYRLDSGLWECQCANHDSQYRLEDAPGIQACALAARLCSQKELEVGEESCEKSNEKSDTSSCSLDLACGKPIALDDTTEARAWLLRPGSVRCDHWVGSPSFNCTCSSGTKKTTYGLVADSGELACGPLADFCSSGTAPVFGEEEQCSPLYTTADSEGCQQAANCGTRMPLADGVSLVQLKERFANCVPNSGGGSECSCSDHESSFLFELSSSPSGASCAAAMSNCNPNAAITAKGPPRCDAPGVDDHGDVCQSSLSCVQDATVGTRSIVAHGSLGLACRRIAPGMPWFCSCASGPKTAPGFELGAAGANGPQACTQASAACLERIGLHLGPYTDFTDLPDPLP